VRINEFRRTRNTATKEAGIEGFHINDLRHCLITRMRRAGVIDTVTMSISGHEIYSAFVRYDTAAPEEIHKALDQIISPQKNKTAPNCPQCCPKIFSGNWVVIEISDFIGASDLIVTGDLHAINWRV
jgi:hypothetical protein